MVSGIGGASAAQDPLRSLEDLGQLLQQSQAQMMRMAEKLLKAGVQQAIQDASVGNRIDVSA